MFKYLPIGLLLVAGCTVGPDYKEPVFAAAGKFPTTVPTFAAAEPVTRWWTSFNDPVLTGLTDDAIAHNFDLATAEANVREARELLVQSRYNQAPIVTTDAGYERQRFSRVSALGTDRNRDLYSAAFDATWELDLFGGVRRETEARQAEFDNASEWQRFVRLSVIAEVARTYAELRGSQESLRIARGNAENQAAHARTDAKPSQRRPRHGSRLGPREIATGDDAGDHSRTAAKSRSGDVPPQGPHRQAADGPDRLSAAALTRSPSARA